jgi:hypothetical protein
MRRLSRARKDASGSRREDARIDLTLNLPIPHNNAVISPRSERATGRKSSETIPCRLHPTFVESNRTVLVFSGVAN